MRNARLTRGYDPEEVIGRIANFRGSEKSDPLHYALLMVKKAQADMGRASLEASMRESEQIDVGRSSLDNFAHSARTDLRLDAIVRDGLRQHDGTPLQAMLRRPVSRVN